MAPASSMYLWSRLLSSSQHTSPAQAAFLPRARQPWGGTSCPLLGGRQGSRSSGFSCAGWGHEAGMAGQGQHSRVVAVPSTAWARSSSPREWWPTPLMVLESPGRLSTCRGAAWPEPEHRNSCGPHGEVRMKFLRRSALRLNEGPRDSSCDGIKQRCMILSSASFSSCAYDSLPLLSAFPGISERPVWSHTIHLTGIFILVLHCDQFLYFICF